MRDAAKFNDDWRGRFGDTPPLGWRLRANQTLPWARFHALPRSKRYAEDEAEWATIIQRANELGDRLLGAGSCCWYAEAVFDDAASDPNSTVEFCEIEDGESVVWRFQVRPLEWRTGSFDSEFRSIANDELRAIWMRRSDGAILAPYDGGFDLFPASFDQIAALRHDHVEWLSPHPAGL